MDWLGSLVPQPGKTVTLPPSPGAAQALVAATLQRRLQRPILLIVNATRTIEEWQREWQFFAAELPTPLVFPDREVLPYDRLNPPAEISTARLATLAALPHWRGLIIAPASAVLQYLPPPSHLDRHALWLHPGARLPLESFRQRAIDAGYQSVSEVSEAGEIAWRGGIIDIFPSGSPAPYRIELFGDEIESIRAFDVETQRSLGKVEKVELLPAREVPIANEDLQRFRARFRARFSGDPQQAEVYRAASRNSVPAGAEQYLPLFFEACGDIFDYLPKDSIVLEESGLAAAVQQLRREWQERYAERSSDRAHPILRPSELLLSEDSWQERLAAHPILELSEQAQGEAQGFLPPPSLQGNSENPLHGLERFLQELAGSARVVLAAESAGRAEAVGEHLQRLGIKVERVQDWSEFSAGKMALALAVAPLERGLLHQQRGRIDLALISEAQIFGDRIFAQRRGGRARQRSMENLLRDLGELQPGDVVVHEDYGIGRFLALNTPFAAQGDVNEYMSIAYAGDAKVYVPVEQLDRVSRFVGNGEEVELSRLGNARWSKAKAKARQKAIDAASELLDIYARRAARPGRSFPAPDDAYWDFVSRFPFEETPDQQAAIDAVIDDLQRPHPMDRLVCGDVGFGKTEVAMRAAFLVAHSGAQVAILVPTTLLAQQHFENFRDRFAGLPIRVATLSRFQKGKERSAILTDTAAGNIQILIGTHRLLQGDVQFADLGLLILDEEHRFGVRHKEKIKTLRSEVDVLTLTATPIPRTLNLSLAGLRDLSLIATPPQRRQPVRTFVQEFSADTIREACQRELHRGGQIYYLHNEVQDIERSAKLLQRLLPEARIRIAHGQMPETELEAVMLDFYHQRFDLLLCTTIIESGIDNPRANTMLIDRADRFGLAQLHQLRGRVGRGHQRAYCYLFTPDPRAMTDDAKRRLDAIQSLEELGVGFALASHDLEIRGAGELLGDAQSGHMDEVGFTLFMEWLNDAVAAIRAGKDPQSLAEKQAEGPQIHLNTPALIPADYLPDVQLRLQLYKRLANLRKSEGIGEIMVEMVDRFGALPDAVKTLLCQTQLRILAEGLGIAAIDAGPQGARLTLSPQHRLPVERLLQKIQKESQTFQLEGQDRLRIRRTLPAGQARCEAILALIDELNGPDRIKE
ncbi:transcription-repair coupling factor [Acidithiobacillus sp. AMEEHan]|uniref:transcription-repair coupling factor n=1 Tax=Acidithiobacillus sp. AMEEHan TaxID=2994951 RepID=UPI0027E42198|nr:transcription-repair coupling factor [Acidithiobacillus sp. AMEEHan]